MKSWWQSKTIWLNLAAVVFTAVEAQFGLLEPYIGDNYGIWVFGLGILNVVLRFITQTGIKR